MLEDKSRFCHPCLRVAAIFAGVLALCGLQSVAAAYHECAEILSKKEVFFREFLPKYFSDQGTSSDQTAFVNLYRGINSDTIVPNFVGEKRLIWTTTKIDEALQYALNSTIENLERVFVLKMTVPKTLVYQRGGWPVLRYEDIVDPERFITRVASIRLTKKLKLFLRRHMGEEGLLIEYVQNVYPGFLEEKSGHWKTFIHQNELE